jgi:membrane associated rhomboid family serine protease
MTDDSGEPREKAPIFNVPPVVGRLIAFCVLVHAVRYFVPNDDALVETLGFVPARYGFAGEATGPLWAAVASPVTYQFLHGGLLHLGLNMISIAAFGTAVERVLGGRRMLAFFLVTGIAAAFAHWGLDPGSTIPVIGASGAISGLFGGVLLLLRDMGRLGSGRGQLVLLIVLWIAMSAVTGEGGPPGTGGEPVAWVAHIGGFLAGLALWRPFARGRYEIRR